MWTIKAEAFERDTQVQRNAVLSGRWSITSRMRHLYSSSIREETVKEVRAESVLNSID